LSNGYSGATILLSVALPEEFDEVKTHFKFKADHSSDRHVRLEFELNEPGFRLIAVLADNMGAQAALEAVEEAIEDFAPTVVVCLGISGAISEDLQPGDVCVSNLIYDVNHNTKLSAEKGKQDVSFSPRPYDVAAQLAASANFVRNHPTLSDALHSWSAAAAARASAAGIPLPLERDPSLFVGPIVCGPLVASKAAKERLRSIDRRILAIDMESGGVFNRLTRKSVLGLSVRGISDMADENKSQLEKSTKSAARKLAMQGALGILSIQLKNPSFMNFVGNRARTQQPDLPGLETKSADDPVAVLDADISERLDCKIFGGRLPSFRLPLPRVREVSYIGELSSRELEKPEDIASALQRFDRLLIRLPRSFPTQTLAWSLAQSLLRETEGGRQLIPIVVDGRDIRQPNHGLRSAWPEEIGNLDSETYEVVYLVEEPLLHDRHRVSFLLREVEREAKKCIIITRSEESDTRVDQFINGHGFKEFDLAPVSFTETASYLERAFDMPPDEAENVAIKLDETFRKFRLNVHPTYFTGLQEDTIAALIHANKRAELIQLAVVGLLSLIVAADKSSQRLGRTTRQKFLELLVVRKNVERRKITEKYLNDLAKTFISEAGFPGTAKDFLDPFYDSGLIYVVSDEVFLSHPYLESFLLAEALRANEKAAMVYFNPEADDFDYYTFDLYCERGPSSAVLGQLEAFCAKALGRYEVTDDEQNVFRSERERLKRIAGAVKVQAFSKRMIEAADKLNDGERSEPIRKEKQRLLDARSHAKTKVLQSRESINKTPSPEVAAEHKVLDALSRAYTISCIAVGSGSETLPAVTKKRIGTTALKLAEAFADLWTRNRLRIDFEKGRAEALKDENIWNFIEENDLDESEFDKIKADVEMFLQGFETNILCEPSGRVLWQLSNSAGFGVLEPIIKQLQPDTTFQRIARAVWLLDANSVSGRKAFKAAMADYSGDGLLRLVLANHFLWRVFWHHYKTAAAQRFIDSAKRALAPLGLAPQEKRIEEVKKGPDSLDGA
jgi:nucleoside phosphorylase